MTILGIYGCIRNGSSDESNLTTDPAVERPVTLCGKVMADPHRLNPTPIEGQLCARCRAVAEGKNGR